MCAGAAKLEQRRMLPVHTPPLVRSVSRGGPPLLRPRVCAFSRSGACAHSKLIFADHAATFHSLLYQGLDRPILIT